MNSIISGDASSQSTLLFLHGTQTPFDSDWMRDVSTVLVRLGHRVIRPEFPEIYKENSQYNDKTDELVESLHKFVVDNELGDDLIIVGKSLGAKVAVRYASKYTVKSLYLLGYPITFQSNEVREDRVQWLNSLKYPVQIIQGEFDKYGKKEVVSMLSFGNHVSIHWIPEVDHSFLENLEEDLSVEVLAQFESIFKSV
jgi:predicted alpha/beta-hydrolase family hydrolase